MRIPTRQMAGSFTTLRRIWQEEGRGEWFWFGGGASNGIVWGIVRKIPTKTSWNIGGSWGWCMIVHEGCLKLQRFFFGSIAKSNSFVYYFVICSSFFGLLILHWTLKLPKNWFGQSYFFRKILLVSFRGIFEPYLEILERMIIAVFAIRLLLFSGIVSQCLGKVVHIGGLLLEILDEKCFFLGDSVPRIGSTTKTWPKPNMGNHTETSEIFQKWGLKLFYLFFNMFQLTLTYVLFGCDLIELSWNALFFSFTKTLPVVGFVVFRNRMPRWRKRRKGCLAKTIP